MLKAFCKWQTHLNQVIISRTIILIIIFIVIIIIYLRTSVRGGRTCPLRCSSSPHKGKQTPRIIINMVIIDIIIIIMVIIMIIVISATSAPPGRD